MKFKVGDKLKCIEGGNYSIQNEVYEVVQVRFYDQSYTLKGKERGTNMIGSFFSNGDNFELATNRHNRNGANSED